MFLVRWDAYNLYEYIFLMKIIFIIVMIVILVTRKILESNDNDSENGDCWNGNKKYTCTDSDCQNDDENNYNK